MATIASPENTQIVRSACRMCHGVCQVLVHLRGGRVVKVTGDPNSPTSRGYICPKGAASPELLYHPDRVTHPLRRTGKRGEGKWKRISWDDALNEVAEIFSRIRRESGPEYVAIAQGTGRPYIDFTLRFANAFGTPNFVAPAKGNRLTIGPNGRVKANVNAGVVVVEGKLEGNIQASDRVDLKQSAIVVGDVVTQRISIDEGASIKGSVNIQKEPPKNELVGMTALSPESVTPARPQS